MPLIPVFEIGIWNVWIFMVAWLFFHMAPLYWPIFRYDLKGSFKKASVSPPYNKTEKKINLFSMLLFFLLFIYSIFLPLPLGTIWFYTGLSIFLLGLVVFEITEISWATTPLDEPITKGLYRYSRHPIYIAVFLQFIGISIVSASWLFMLLMIVHIILSLLLIIPEERLCLEKYGEVYREYMERTPRWIGIPKAVETD